MMDVKKTLCAIAILCTAPLMAMNSNNAVPLEEAQTSMDLETATRKELVRVAFSKITVPEGLTKEQIKDACDVTENWAFSFENDLDQYTTFLTSQLEYRANKANEQIKIVCGTCEEDIQQPTQ